MYRKNPPNDKPALPPQHTTSSQPSSSNGHALVNIQNPTGNDDYEPVEVVPKDNRERPPPAIPKPVTPKPLIPPSKPGPSIPGSSTSGPSISGQGRTSGRDNPAFQPDPDKTYQKMKEVKRDSVKDYIQQMGDGGFKKEYEVGLTA